MTAAAAVDTHTVLGAWRSSWVGTRCMWPHKVPAKDSLTD